MMTYELMKNGLSCAFFLETRDIRRFDSHFNRSGLWQADRRKIIAGVRTDVLSFLDKHNFKYVPSVSNKFMVDVRRPGGEIIEALRKEKIYIGRVWKSWPTYVRVSIGTQEEMNKFKTAFLKVMA